MNVRNADIRVPGPSSRVETQARRRMRSRLTAHFPALPRRPPWSQLCPRLPGTNARHYDRGQGACPPKVYDCLLTKIRLLTSSPRSRSGAFAGGKQYQVPAITCRLPAGPRDRHGGRDSRYPNRHFVLDFCPVPMTHAPDQRREDRGCGFRANDKTGLLLTLSAHSRQRRWLQWPIMSSCRRPTYVDGERHTALRDVHDPITRGSGVSPSTQGRSMQRPHQRPPPFPTAPPWQVSSRPAPEAATHRPR